MLYYMLYGKSWASAKYFLHEYFFNFTSSYVYVDILIMLTWNVGFLPPSRRRSLFTLATSMLVFFSKAFNIPSLIPVVKHVLTKSTVSEDVPLPASYFLQWSHVYELYRRLKIPQYFFALFGQQKICMRISQKMISKTLKSQVDRGQNSN